MLVLYLLLFAFLCHIRAYAQVPLQHDYIVYITLIVTVDLFNCTVHCDCISDLVEWLCVGDGDSKVLFD